MALLPAEAALLPADAAVSPLAPDNAAAAAAAAAAWAHTRLVLDLSSAFNNITYAAGVKVPIIRLVGDADQGQHGDRLLTV